ncbi:MAG: hypothetical protein ABI233_04310 [Chthoniobacterales bacterium]
MARKYYMPAAAEAVDQVFVACDANLNANGGALATKYAVTADELARLAQGRLVWHWFMDSLSVARDWAVSMTQQRDLMHGAPGALLPLPSGPTLPPAPTDPAHPLTILGLEPGFLTFFTDLVARIKNAGNYLIADGVLLGIEGSEIAPPDPTTVPKLSGEIFTSGHPELTCRKGVFQGYEVWLTRPGVAKKSIGFSTARRFNVNEAMPAAGTAEVWTFEVQYRYKDAPFGQFSQPLNLNVRG